MKMLTLNKEKTNAFEIDELYRMRNDLNDFLNEEEFIFKNQWRKNLDIILDFQDSDGSFKLLDSFHIPSDARVDFCYMPTYICCAILMKAFMTDCSAFSSREKSALQNGLKISCSRNLTGHGYDGLSGQIDAINIFMKGGIREFMDLYPDFCPEFSEMINRIISNFLKRESKNDLLGAWGESYETKIKAINEYFSQRKVFVYGTLMSGEDNHYHLQNSTFLSLATVHGYDMYDVGWYPAIVRGQNSIRGELYQVPVEDMGVIDTLEGEGSLYRKKCGKVTDIEGETSFAFVYVYMRDVSNLKKIPAWKNHVWYVSYGSNMLKERFMCYIKGGSFRGSRYREPCRDTSLPKAVKTVEVPYDMYFGNVSGSWENGGVSFIDTSKEGCALGVAYLISEEQFKHVREQENGGKFPGNGEWYTEIIDLGRMNGFKVKTITNTIPRDPNKPSQKYLDALHEGIKENWPQMSDGDIDDYLNNCIR